jgi:hypothetical protein
MDRSLRTTSANFHRPIGSWHHAVAGDDRGRFIACRAARAPGSTSARDRGDGLRPGRWPRRLVDLFIVVGGCAQFTDARDPERRRLVFLGAPMGGASR